MGIGSYNVLQLITIQDTNNKISECSPPSVNNAIFLPSGNVAEGTTVTITCKKPKRHVLMGEKYVTCLSTGWSDIPECKKCGKLSVSVLLEKTFGLKCTMNIILAFKLDCRA